MPARPRGCDEDHLEERRHNRRAVEQHFGLLPENGVNKAAQLHADRPTWQGLQRAGMLSDVGWEASAARCAALCRRWAGQ